MFNDCFMDVLINQMECDLRRLSLGKSTSGGENLSQKTRYFSAEQYFSSILYLK